VKRVVIRIETRSVLAGVYVNQGLFTPGAGGEPRTHAVEVDEERWPVRVLCGPSPKVENLADEGACDPFAPPTCSRCVAKLARLAELAEETSK